MNLKESEKTGAFSGRSVKMQKRFPKNYSPHELATLSRHAQKANPPPILFRYRGNPERILSEISEPHIYFCEPSELNDPFEYRAPVYWNKESLRRAWESYALGKGLSKKDAEAEFEHFSEECIGDLEKGFESLREDSGVVCFSGVSDSVRMWSYYANSHRGICIGYDSSVMPFCFATAVKYQNPDKPLDVVGVTQGNDPTNLASHVSFRKGDEWRFEQEYRIATGEIGDRSRRLSIKPQTIASIRFGAAISSDFRGKVLDALKNIPHRPRLIQMHCDYDRFVLTEESIG